MSNSVQVTMPLKSTGIAYLWWVFFGQFGAHKLYLGRPWLALLWACTFGLFTFGTIWDLFTLPSQVRKANRRLMAETKGLVAGGSKPSFPASSFDDAGRFATIDFEKYRTPQTVASAPTPFGRRPVR